jgi:hypothetical protein
MSSHISNLDTHTKSLVVKVDTPEDRKKIHVWLERTYPQLGKRSIALDCFGTQSNLYARCEKHLVKLGYHTGIECNNKDEYYSGHCEEHDETFNYEPNYDSSSRLYFHVRENNAIIIADGIGSIIGGKIDVTDEEIEDILNKCPIYIIGKPNLRSVKRIAQFANAEVSKQFQSLI